MAHKLLHIHDSLLGYVPRPGARSKVANGRPVTIDDDGFRVTGKSHLSSEGLILAIGDSFTYGEDVGDSDAWPAQLQELIGRPVVNAGVSGYGFDQIVLRAERLVEVLKPSVLIVSFIPDDIYRTEMRRMWWHDKPWFELEDGDMVLKGVPVPDRTKLPLSVRVQIERILVRLPPSLQHMTGYHVRKHRRGVGRSIALRLTERLARLQHEHEMKVVVMAQYDPRVWMSKADSDELRGLTQAILGCAAANGVATLDTYHRLAAEPARLKLYGSVHLTARGNLMIARLLAATLPSLLSGGAGKTQGAKSS